MHVKGASMMEHRPYHSLRTVISGSYRRHLRDMFDLRDVLEACGIQVLSPVGNAAENPGDEFLFLDADILNDKRILQDSVFGKIRTASFLVLANFEGYIGVAASMEAGYAIAQGLQILTTNDVSDPNLRPYCRPIKELFSHFHAEGRQDG